MVSPKRYTRIHRRKFRDKIETLLDVPKIGGQGGTLLIEHILVFAITAFVTLWVYLNTLSPSIAGGDSGELVAEGCQLGTAHPPGYPLYTILVYLITKFGRWIVSIFHDLGLLDNVHRLSPAMLVNAMSSILGSAASGLISSSIFHLAEKDNNTTSSKIATVGCAIATGLLHSFSPLSWQYSVTAEVFALHNFLVAWVVYTAIRLSLCPSNVLLYQGAFIAGLALANQHTSILLLVPVVCFVIYWAGLYEAFILFPSPAQCKTVQRARQLLGRCAMIFLVTFCSLYSTLPIFSSFFPHAGSWGDVRSLAGFLRHLLRKDYGTLQLFSGNDQGSEGLLERIKLWCIDLATVQTNTIFFTFSMFGFFRYIAKVLMAACLWNKDAGNQRLPGGIMISVSVCFYLVVFHYLSNLPLKNPLFYGIHQRFWLHPNVLAFILIGDGMNRLFSALLQRGRRFCLGEKWIASIVILTLFLFVYESFRQNYDKSDHSANFFFRNYASSILETLPKGSLLFINYDQQWTSIRYMQECENVRRDITSINLSMMSYAWWKSKRRLYSNIHFPGNYYGMSRSRDTFTFSDLVLKNYKLFNGNIFLGGHLSYPDPKYSDLFDEIPHGLVRHIHKKASGGSIKVSASMNADGYRKESLVTWRNIGHIHSIGLPDLKKFSSNTWEWTVHREFLDHFQSRATHLLDLAVTEDEPNPDAHLLSLLESAYWLEISRLNDDYAAASPSVYRNLGLAYMHIVRSHANKSTAQRLFPMVADIFVRTNNSVMSQKVREIWYNSTSSHGKTSGWKDWASTRWDQTWGYYLQMNQAKNDSAYQQIYDIYQAVHNSLPRR